MIQQPSALHCFVCGVENSTGLGIRFFETGGNPNEVQAKYAVPERYQSYPGVVHGGIVAAILDEAASRTVFRGSPPRVVVTAKLSIRYRKPVPVNLLLTITGRVVADKGRVITTSSELRDPEGSLLAEAEVVLMEVDPGMFGEMTEDQTGWRVYDDHEQVDGK